MGLDSPIRVVYYNLVESLFQEHPARIRVIGSVDSIRQITKELLFMCHDTFYHPSNMVVAVAGDVSFDDVMRVVEADMAGRGYSPRDPVKRVIPDEPAAVARGEVRQKMQVSRPLAYLGFKGRLDQGESESSSAYHRRLIGAELALDAVLGRSTESYWKLYEESVIASRYGYSLSTYPGAAYFYVGCETEDADAFRDRVTELLVAAREKGIEPERFEEARRRAIGQLLGTMDDLQGLVHQYVTHSFEGLDFLERRDLLDRVTQDDALNFLREFVREEQRTFSVVEPL